MQSRAPAILDLQPDCIANPTSLDIDFVACTMLWPDNMEARERALQTALVATLRSHASNFPQDVAPGFFELAADSKPLAQTQKDLRPNFEKGLCAGTYLRDAIAQAEMTGKAPTMKQLINRDLLGAPINKHTFQNHIWPVYRCVAHFWAACIDFGGRGSFPCTRENFGDFLDVAEGYREMGCETRGRQARRPVLRNNESVRLPDWFQRRLKPVFPSQAIF